MDDGPTWFHNVAVPFVAAVLGFLMVWILIHLVAWVPR